MWLKKKKVKLRVKEDAEQVSLERQLLHRDETYCNIKYKEVKIWIYVCRIVQQYTHYIYTVYVSQLPYNSSIPPHEDGLCCMWIIGLFHYIDHIVCNPCTNQSELHIGFDRGVKINRSEKIRINVRTYTSKSP